MARSYRGLRGAVESGQVSRPFEPGGPGSNPGRAIKLGVGTVIDIFEEVVEKREHHPAFVHLLRGEEGSYYWPVEAREGYVLEPSGDP